MSGNMTLSAEGLSRSRLTSAYGCLPQCQVAVTVWQQQEHEDEEEEAAEEASAITTTKQRCKTTKSQKAKANLVQLLSGECKANRGQGKAGRGSKRKVVDERGGGEGKEEEGERGKKKRLTEASQVCVKQKFACKKMKKKEIAHVLERDSHTLSLSVCVAHN